MNFKRISLLSAGTLLAFWPAFGQEPLTQKPTQQILFVCEHGNAKSLMAALYFNQMARQKGLSIRAISRGISPDSDVVLPAIAEGLRNDGFDLSGFHPQKISAKDTAESSQVVLISTELPQGLKGPAMAIESWGEIPPASLDFQASRQALKQHIEQWLAAFVAQLKK